MKKGIYFHPGVKLSSPLPDDDRLLYYIGRCHNNRCHIYYQETISIEFLHLKYGVSSAQTRDEWKSVPNRLWQWWHVIRWNVRPWMIERDKFIEGRRGGEGWRGRGLSCVKYGLWAMEQGCLSFLHHRKCEIFRIDTWETPSVVIFKYHSQSPTDSWGFQISL